jgi:hypothetical protein
MEWEFLHRGFKIFVFDISFCVYLFIFFLLPLAKNVRNKSFNQAEEMNIVCIQGNVTTKSHVQLLYTNKNVKKNKAGWLHSIFSFYDVYVISNGL